MGSERQMRLGEMIEALAALPQDKRVRFDFGYFKPTDVDSYRGYYEQLAIGFDESGEPTVGDLLAKLRVVKGRTLEGYKGGYFRMDAHTPVWVANYGQCHDTAITGVTDERWCVVLHTGFQP